MVYKVKNGAKQGLLVRFYTWHGDNPPEELEKLKPIKEDVHPWINFVWWDNPAPGVPSEFFAVMWKGFIYIPRTGEYRFYVTTDDGSRLWIDDTLVIDAWKDQPPTTYVSEPIMLNSGYHRLKYYFYNRYAFAEAVLGWIPPVGEPGVIPSEYFRFCSGDKIRFIGLPDDYAIEVVTKEFTRKCYSVGKICDIGISWNEIPLKARLRIYDENGELIHESPSEMELWGGDEVKIMITEVK
ncbi:beta-glucosidase [Desulfurococcaceae archaeon MEX13E-LK6-19]|nr:beta-glucosidase [Desulfurococcaceae archaeon MEX13E-LK6-19]